MEKCWKSQEILFSKPGRILVGSFTHLNISDASLTSFGIYLVQDSYGLTRKKLQRKVFWYQKLDKNELNNISKVHQNPPRETQASGILRGPKCVIFLYTN